MDFLQRRRFHGNGRRADRKELNWTTIVSLITIIGVVVGVWQHCDKAQEELSDLRARVTTLEREYDERPRV